MSSFRQIHSKIWKDDWFLELEPINKLFFIYLFSNESASLAGIYELSIRVMSFESGLTMPEIRAAFEIFTTAKKAYYQDGVVWVPNLRKYHDSKSPKVQTRIIKDIENVRNCELKGIYCQTYSIDTVSVEENSVSIPPYTYTSTISSSSDSSFKGGVGGNGVYDGHAENQNSQELNDVLSAICSVAKGLNVLAPSDDLERFAAYVLKTNGADKIAGFRSWWDINGNYKGKPALKSMIGDWDNYMEGVDMTNGNDTAPSVVNAVLKEMGYVDK